MTIAAPIRWFTPDEFEAVYPKSYRLAEALDARAKHLIEQRMRVAELIKAQNELFACVSEAEA